MVVAGPEPGYVATPLLCLALSRTILDSLGGPDGPNAPEGPGKSGGRFGGDGGDGRRGINSVDGVVGRGAGLYRVAGCAMPAALLGDGPALDAFLNRLRHAGIHVSVA